MVYEEKLIQKVLVAIDGSIYSDKVARYGEEIAKHHNAEITLIHVVEPPKIILPMSGMETTLPMAEIELTEKLATEMENKAKKLLNQYKKDMENKGINVKILIERGNVSETILTIAEEEGYDLIIVGCRGLGNIKRFILGSVSDKISKHANCSVLIVR
ncbi:MAG: universal stress protein [Candidatus Freyarchaeota archaeon]